MGMLVSVFRWSRQDCTNGGVSARRDQLCITNAEGPFNPSEDAPAATLEHGPYGSLRIVPAALKGSGKHFMFGGNYAATSDSRWSAIVRQMGGGNHDGPVAIHDRVE